MFVVHTISDRGPVTTMDYGHVNQFIRHVNHDYSFDINPAKDNPVWRECVKQGFIYVHFMTKMKPDGAAKFVFSYHKRLDLLLEDVAYNRAND